MGTSSSHVVIASLVAFSGCALAEQAPTPPEQAASTSEALSDSPPVASPGTVVVDGNNLSDPPGKTLILISIGTCYDTDGRALPKALRPRDVSFIGVGTVDVTRNCERQVRKASFGTSGQVDGGGVYGWFYTFGGKVPISGVYMAGSDVQGALKVVNNAITFDRTKLPALHIDTRRLTQTPTSTFRFLEEDVTGRAVTYWLPGAVYAVVRRDSPAKNTYMAGKFYWGYGGGFRYATGEVTGSGLDVYWGAVPGAVDPCARDKTPPVATLSVSPTTLGAPNHKLIPIALTKTAIDACDKAPKTSCAATANQTVNMIGSGNTSPDIQWIGEQLYLRAERSGTRTDRVYTVTCTTTDASGNATKASATVTVPHDAGKR